METIGMNTPFFSIIVPLYNKERTVARCIESVLVQTCQDWELLLINDGSKDASGEAVARFTDPRIRYMEHENHGVSYTRNRGLREARGQYIHFLDADDYLLPDRLQNIYDAIEKDKADIYITGIISENVAGNRVRHKYPYCGPLTKITFLSTYCGIDEGTSIYGYVCTKIISREFYNKNGLEFDENLSLAEDKEFYLRCYEKAHTFCGVDDEGYVYKHYESGTSAFVVKVDYFQQIQVLQSQRILLGEVICQTDDERLKQKIVEYVRSSLYCVSPANIKVIPCICKRIEENRELLGMVQQYGKGDKILQMFMNGHIRQLQIYVWIKQMYIKLYQWLHQK